MNVLLTGSSGRIGQAIAVRLRRSGHEVIGLDRAPASVTQVLADLNDEAALRRAMQGVDAVVHTAALHAPHVPHWPESAFEAINVQGTAAVLRCCRALQVPRLVFTSTTALYGAATALPDRAAWITEDTQPQPRTVYHRSKLQAEALLREASEQFGLQVTVLRMSRCFPQAAPVMALYRLHRGVDARDVAAAHELALARQGDPYRSYIVSGATPFEPADAAELKTDAAAVLQRRAAPLAQALVERGWTLPRSIDRVYCPQRVQQELGWRPRFGWREVFAQFDAESPEVLPPPTFMTPIASPCISVCKMSPEHGLCMGCGRTLDEIAGWSSMSEAQKLQVWQAIEARQRAGQFVPYAELPAGF
jgi:UDP-glucose 4-epimerase